MIQSDSDHPRRPRRGEHPAAAKTPPPGHGGGEEAEETGLFGLPERISPNTLLADRYRVAELLGKGGMGEVFRGHDQRLDRDVAIKVLPEHRALDPDALKRFEREIKAVAALSHPHVMAIHDIGVHEKIPFAVMELLKGETLRILLTGHPLAVDQVRRIGQGVAAGLAAAHAREIIHRDIKPENVMVNLEGHVKILDFGLARRTLPRTTPGDSSTARLTLSGVTPGTVPYMSPEQVTGESLTAATDIFSFGVVLYETATGRNPYRADTHFETFERIVWQRPEPPSHAAPELPAALDALIMRMLERNPVQRPGAQEIEAALSKSGGGTPPSTFSVRQETAPRHTVGRQTQLDELRTRLQNAADRRGSMLCIAGEAGIGKTTLVEDFLHELESAGHHGTVVARGRCSERLAGSDGYLPFLEALESLLKHDRHAGVHRLLQQYAPAWYVQIATSSGGESLGDAALADARSASQERMKRELAVFLGELGRLGPVVLFLDDIHWVDVSTADLLAYLGSKCGNLRLLLVVSFRPTELSLSRSPFVDAKLELQGRGLCKEIALEFLGREDIRTYLDLEFPAHAFPEEFAGLIHARTEGSPLFMVDLLRYLKDEGVIAQQDGRWALARSVPEMQRDLPESVRSMIQKKIGQLSDSERQILVAASVQGYEFHAAVIARALDRDEAEVEECLEHLDRVHYLVRNLEEEEFPDRTLTVKYTFVHVLYQNALYDTLTPARKAKLAASVAQVLEATREHEQADIALELALLWEVARDFDKASDFFLKAAENDAKLYANHEAIALAGRAMQTAEKLSESGGRRERVLRVAFFMAQLYQTLGKYHDGIASFELAERVAQELERVDAVVEAVCGMANCAFYLKQMGDAQKHGARALELARRHNLQLGVAQAESVIALERLCMGEFETAERFYDRAIPVLKAEGRPIQAMDAVSFRLLLHAWRLEYRELDAKASWWVEMAREFGANIVQMHFWRSMALGNQGRLSEALETVREGRRLAELNDDPYHITRLPNIEGWLHRELQDFDTAVELDSQSLALGMELGFEEAAANAHVNLGHNYTLLGEHERAHEQLHAAERLFNQDPWFRWRYNIRLQAEFASHWIARGDLTVATSHAKKSLELAQKSLSRKHIAWAYKLLADIAALEDRVDEAAHHFDQALKTFDGYPCPTIEWKVLKAMLHLARQRRDNDAIDQLERRARQLTESLARQIGDDKLRQVFLQSRAIREL